MDNIEFYAAQLEWRQAERDYSDAFQAFHAHPVWASKEDYAVWATANYANTALNAMMDISIS